MTMRVVIQNDDQTRKLRVVVRDNLAGVMTPGAGTPPEVEPKGSLEVWLHAGRDCILEEVQS